MKTKTIFILFIVISITAIAFSKFSFHKNHDEPWTTKQLMEPTELAKIIRNGSSERLYIYCIGPSGLIKNAVDIGEGKNKKNIEKLSNEVKNLPKDAAIIIYCGCCPFENCPNIRPAFTLLNEMKFTNHKLLNLSHNLKVDWIDKGYPMNK